MNPWLVTQSPSTGQATWAETHGFLFAMQAWGDVLEGLGCRVAYAWNRELRAGVAMPIFSMGPVKVGFLGFPVAGEAFDGLDPEAFTAHAGALAQAAGCHLVRGVQSIRPEPGAAMADGLPKVWIENLQAWPGTKGKRIAKDLGYALRMLADDRMVVDEVRDASAVWELYRRTVLGHAGRVRYSREYFHRLKLLCDKSTMARGVSCIDVHGGTTAFAIMVRNGSVGYYLHGGVRDDARTTGVGDLLLARLIELARGMEIGSFSLMASPRAQPGLLKYKSKWGDSQRTAMTRDVGHGAVGKAVCWLAGRFG